MGKLRVVAFVIISILCLFSFIIFPHYTEIPSSRKLQFNLHKIIPTPDNIQVIGNESAFVYSAYIDDRRARDAKLSRHRPVVRIFAYFLNKVNPIKMWKCIFWYNTDQATQIGVDIPINGVTNLDLLLIARYKYAMILCNLPNATTDNHELKGVYITSINSTNATNFLHLIDLRKFRVGLLDEHLQSSLHQENQSKTGKKKTSNSIKFKYPLNYTVCNHSPFHGGMYEVSDIVNFIELSRLFGAQKFIFYLPPDMKPSLLYCLQSYKERGIVDIYPFTVPDLKDVTYYGQTISMNDCLYRNMYQTKYLVMQDIDEVFVPLKSDNWQTMMDEIHARAKENPNTIASYSFSNQFVSMDAPDDEEFRNSFLAKRYSIKSLLKTTKNRAIFIHGNRSKVIVRPEKILVVSVHHVDDRDLMKKGDVNYKLSRNDALLFHYRNVAVDKQTVRDRRMHRNAVKIIESIKIAIDQCQLPTTTTPD